MTREQLELINEMVDLDYIIDNPESVYNIITEMIYEIKNKQNENQILKELIEPYHKIALELNKENKKLYKQIKK